MSLKHFILFTSDASGIEKLLRLLQAVSQILAALTTNRGYLPVWLLLRAQFALGRRYLRFFRFLDSFLKTRDCILTSSGLGLLLGAGKSGFLGIYLFLESLTILDAMGVWPTPWARMCLIEANKFWFYSLVCSILVACVTLFGKEEEIKEKEKAASGGQVKTRSQRAKDVEKLRSTSKTDWWRLARSLITDGCDLLIPGFVTGWLVTSPVIVGVATVISTTLSSKDIWDKYGQKTR